MVLRFSGSEEKNLGFIGIGVLGFADFELGNWAFQFRDLWVSSQGLVGFQAQGLVDFQPFSLPWGPWVRIGSPFRPTNRPQAPLAEMPSRRGWKGAVDCHGGTASAAVFRGGTFPFPPLGFRLRWKRRCTTAMTPVTVLG